MNSNSTLFRSSPSSIDLIRRQRTLSQADAKIFQGQVSPSYAGVQQNSTYFKMKRFHYIHIPKTAGESFLLDSPLHIGVGSTLQGNHEKSYSETPQLFLDDDPTRYAVVFLRKPTSHVLSQFLECKYDPYFRNIATDLPGYSLLANATGGFDEWISNFIEMELTRKYGKEFGYRCYEPWNMQARYLTASGKKKNPHFAADHSGRFPSLKTAEMNLRKMDIVGITEYYSASLCLLEYVALDGTLSPLCRQCDPATGQIIAQEKQHRESHGVPHHSVDMISEQSLQFIEHNLTTIDQQLYAIGLQLFSDQVETVWRATGVDLLCRDDYYYQPKQVPVPENDYNKKVRDPTKLLYLIPLFVLCSLFVYRKARSRLRHGSIC